MKLALIGTSSFDRTAIVDAVQPTVVPTRYGDVAVEIGESSDGALILVRRAGVRHPLEPGRINYRAIMLALRELGVDRVIATCVVGSLREGLDPGTLVCIDQFLDFTRHRPPTLYDDHGFHFADMSEPYCRGLRGAIGIAAESANIRVVSTGCYVGVDGPRYETAAEVRMFRTLGGDVVGHTGVTEAIMAREAGLCYATIALVANHGAGIAGPVFHDEMSRTREQHAEVLHRIVRQTVSTMRTVDLGPCGCAEALGSPQLSAWSDPVRMRRPSDRD
jgi:5'-methylthioadenosine phosphorylase